jgi:IS605 OrfB family transposase
LINKFAHEKIKQIVIEELKGLKKGKRYFKEFKNKMQRWVYSNVVCKLERFCEENGILLTKINPAYTSQICSNCGFSHKNNRQKQLFKCLSCGSEFNADYNAALNILHRGVIIPLPLLT